MIEDIKYLSKKTNKTLRECLNLLFIQEIILKINRSDYKDNILLNGDYLFELNNGFINDVYMDLDFAYITNEASENNVLNMINNIVNIELDNDIFRNINAKVICESKENYGARFEIQLTGEIDEIRIPLVICVDAGDLKQDVNTIFEPTLYSNIFSLNSINTSSIERILAERFYGIIKKQLIYNPKLFFDIYWILSNYIFDGRKLREAIVTVFGLNEYKADEKEFICLLDLKNNININKRWVAYLNTNNKEKISFNTVIDMIEKAFGEIWSGLFIDKVFLGSWMPKLCRYLD